MKHQQKHLAVNEKLYASVCWQKDTRQELGKKKKQKNKQAYEQAIN